MTLVVGFLGDMMADSKAVSCAEELDRRPRVATKDHLKIMPAPNLTPPYVDEKGEEHTPDFMGVAGNTNAVEMFKLDPTDMLSLFGLEKFVPGDYDLSLINFNMDTDISLKVMFRVGEKFFTVWFDGRSLEISKLANYASIGSGAGPFRVLTKMFFDDKAVTGQGLATAFKLLMMSGVDKTVGGNFQYLLAGKDMVFSELPKITQEERENLVKRYKRTLYELSGHQLPEEVEEEKIDRK
ncbi:hypothetical protein HWC35_gp172 [Vibrio phage USC-1]|uniref:Uncharacterized protein n=2 Tax=Aphroditevirus USC1 TaxID=2846605 RepID=A0A514A2W1_9CAUD|nr:hypothetical protein HWC35_gp172 [Vibrio phage USC-1]QCW23162.1 hypothetical protein [Vibrio phage 5 TSL-2019]QDH47566.1 hypothetical protein [Vibrio phage USC-1]